MLNEVLLDSEIRSAQKWRIRLVARQPNLISERCKLTGVSGSNGDHCRELAQKASKASADFLFCHRHKRERELSKDIGPLCMQNQLHIIVMYILADTQRKMD